MKKLLSVVLFTLGVFAAMPAAAQVKIGVKAGVNVSKMSLNKDVFKTSNRMGYFIGPTVKFTLPVVGLGMDASALFSQQEAKIEGLAGSSTTILKQRQVIVPVNVKYTIGLGSTANIFAFAGPQVGFNVGNKAGELLNDALDWRLKSSDFSVNVGAGLTVASHFQVTANYNVGIGKTGDVTYQALENAAKNHKAHATSWQIGVAYFF